jgi:molybdopterin converting factor subunit 1
MHVHLRYFAALREAAERDGETLDAPDGADVATLRALLAERYPTFAPILARAAPAVNRAYVSGATILRDGDELAFIPPVGGGSPAMTLPILQITRDPLDDAAVADLVHAVEHAGAGGLVIFQGIVRDNSGGKRIRYLEYDAYPEMAVQEMARIAGEVQRRWQTERIAVVHRIGRLEIGECSVVVAVACPHRAEAFDACRYAIDTLKTTVPIWKKEVAEDGEAWIEG